jgi:hypothetical protein
MKNQPRFQPRFISFAGGIDERILLNTLPPPRLNICSAQPHFGAEPSLERSFPDAQEIANFPNQTAQ